MNDSTYYILQISVLSAFLLILLLFIVGFLFLCEEERYNAKMNGIKTRSLALIAQDSIFPLEN